jgi:hypothetical protein
MNVCQQEFNSGAINLVKVVIHIRLLLDVFLMDVRGLLEIDLHKFFYTCTIIADFHVNQAVSCSIYVGVFGSQHVILFHHILSEVIAIHGIFFGLLPSTVKNVAFRCKGEVEMTTRRCSCMRMGKRRMRAGMLNTRLPTTITRQSIQFKMLSPLCCSSR